MSLVEVNAITLYLVADEDGECESEKKRAMGTEREGKGRVES